MDTVFTKSRVAALLLIIAIALALYVAVWVTSAEAHDLDDYYEMWIS